MNCPECGSSQIIQDNGWSVCLDCGAAIERVISLGPACSDSEQSGMAGKAQAPKRFGQRDHRGYLLDAETNFQFARLSILMDHSQTIDAAYKTNMTIRKVCGLLQVPSHYTRRALYLFNKFTRIKRPKNSKPLSAAAIYYAIHEHGGTRPIITINEICRAYTSLGHWVTPRLIQRDLVILRKTLKLAAIVPYNYNEIVEHYLNKIEQWPGLEDRLRSKGLGIGPIHYVNQLRAEACKIIPYFEKHLQRNKFVSSAILLYISDGFASNHYNHKRVLTQKHLSVITGTAENSIRTIHSTYIRPRLNKIFDFAIMQTFRNPGPMRPGAES